MNPELLEKALRNANWEIKRVLEAGLGYYILHPEIRTCEPELYRDDGVTLSERGKDIFLNDLQQGLREDLGPPVGTGV